VAAPDWKPKIERREHPYGEQGVRSSLDAVADKAAKGGADPRVRAWAIECLERARRSGKKVGNERGRAEALLGAVQKKLWVPDPVGTEFIAGAHLTACTDKDAPCFHGGDCFPEETLVLKECKGEAPILVRMRGLRAQDRIWGLNSWTVVEAVVTKGSLAVDVVHLSNDSKLRLTNNHKVYVREGEEERRIAVTDLEVGMVLSQPHVATLPHTSSQTMRREPDGVHVERIERATVLTLCCDIQTSDHRVYLPECDVTVANCDDLVVLLASSFLSVGLNTMVVGHAYNTQKNIQHVLAAVRIADQWQYADPSTDFPLGKCERFTRERLLSVPNVKVVCDETSCLSNPASIDPDREGFVEKGLFVGVDGVPHSGREIWWISWGKRP